jgi:hypothetical protein
MLFTPSISPKFFYRIQIHGKRPFLLQIRQYCRGIATSHSGAPTDSTTVPFPRPFVARLSELLFGPVDARKQFHLNQWFAKDTPSALVRKKLKAEGHCKDLLPHAQALRNGKPTDSSATTPPPKCRYNRRRIPPSLSYVTERGEWKMDRNGKGEYKDDLVLSVCATVWRASPTTPSSLCF